MGYWPYLGFKIDVTRIPHTHGRPLPGRCTRLGDAERWNSVDGKSAAFYGSLE
jgi:hypothetical protein